MELCIIVVVLFLRFWVSKTPYAIFLLKSTVVSQLWLLKSGELSLSGRSGVADNLNFKVGKPVSFLTLVPGVVAFYNYSVYALVVFVLGLNVRNLNLFDNEIFTIANSNVTGLQVFNSSVSPVWLPNSSVKFLLLLVA